MKRSKKVALVITSSVVLAGCDNTSEPQGTTVVSYSTNYVDDTSQVVTNYSTRRTTTRSWYHPTHYFSSGSSSGSRPSATSPSRSSPSRGGFGNHSSSS
ncbi:MAG TPA: hypothetical protein VGK40_05250 [Verrucomicrobiae bacterium]